MIGITPADAGGDYDVVVAGSGAAGLVAALRAADAGLSVLVLEKAAKFGGTTAVSGGVMWAPCNHLMAAAGHPDSGADAAAYLAAAADGAMTDDEVGWYVRTAAEAVRYLDTRTRVSYRPLGRPDYHLDLPCAASGRGLDNEAFDPAGIPALADSIRQPTYFPLISMAERDALKGAPVDPELLAERRTSGIRTIGGALVGALLASALDRGIAVAAGARVTALESGPDGWRLTVHGRRESIRATSVVLATGGFEWNPDLRRALLTFPVTPIGAPSNEGDGLMLGLRAGAGLSDATAIWGVPVIAAPTHLYDGLPSGRMGNVEMTLPGSITVNAQGRRFVNEALNYHDLVRVFANVDPAGSRQGNSPAWLVFDSDFLRKYSVAGSLPGRPEPWMTAAPTLAELARLIAVSSSGLAATVARFNADAAVGTDSEFNRGASREDRHLGDPANKPNPCLAPLLTAPFYAVPIHAGVLGTAGGLKVSPAGQVLTPAGTAVVGLYAAGNCAASVFHGAYPGGGATLGSAITRAYAIGGLLAAAGSPTSAR
ncbi:MAG: FAD-dependent oxidoreductase [Actinomycetales bacterium]|jgi:3-oxosteroid 1-dehydrogenase